MSELYNNILKLMEDIDSFTSLTGTEKKEYVLLRMKEKLGNDRYNQMYDIIDTVIETVVMVSRNKKLRINVKKKVTRLGKLLGCAKE